MALVTALPARGQGDCADPITLTDVNNWCSANGAFITYPAASGYGKPSCWGAVNRETWFEFTAVATYVHISVYGATYGGDLQRPEIALYSGVCGGTLNELKCTWAPNGVHYAEIFHGGLTVGQKYLIRVDGINNPEKNFKLCINNFNTTTLPGQDCSTASYLCTKQDISLEFQPGGGSNVNEAANTCMDGFGDPLLSPSETNSLWLKWECGTSGTLTFDIIPTQQINDLDWCLFELPLGINNCSVKNDIRCNSSSCEGPTGLNMTSTDLVEDPDCDFGEDLYCRYVDMVAGRAYALVINNFTTGQDGFTLSFGGTGGFKNLNADFDMVQACGSNTVTFTNQSTNASQYAWNFGTGASPATANTPGPHTVTYPDGNYTAVLTITDAEGCTDFEYVNFDVPEGNLTFTTGTNPESCPGAGNGSVSVQVTAGTAPYQYSIDGGSTFTAPTASSSYTFSSLGAGTFDVAVTDASGCQQTAQVTISAGAGVTIASITPAPEDCDALNGSISVTVSGGTPPYQYSADGGSGFSAATPATSYTFNGLGDGTYHIVVKDAAGCTASQSGVAVAEQNPLSLSASPSPATCGLANGSLSVTAAGGAGPFQFSADNGATFTAPQAAATYVFSGLSGGSYNLVVTDANGCSRSGSATVADIAGVILSGLSVTDAQCGANDGSVQVTVSGGTPPYAFSSDGGATFGAPQAGTSYTFTGLAAGNYDIAVSDANTCTDTDAALVGDAGNSVFTAISGAICTGDSLAFGGTYLQLAGVYTDSLLTAAGCDSLVELTLTVLALPAGSATIDLCPGETYVLPGGQSATAPGVFTDTIAGANCDSIVTVTLNELPLPQATVNAAICSGESYTLPGGDVVALAGTYTDTIAGFRCDSVVTVNLSVQDFASGAVTIDLCPGESYVLPGGQSATAPGVFTDTIAGASCDSVVTVTLNELTLPQASVNATICSGESYTLPGGDVVILAGTYTDTIAGFRCDSVVTVNLTVQDFASGTITVNLCPDETYVLPGGQSATAPGVFTDTLAGASCDSVVTVTLNELTLPQATVNAAICSGETYTLPGGNVVTMAGAYTDTIAGFRCDSVVTVNLAVQDFATGAITVNLCPGEAYVLPGGQSATAPGVFTDTLAGASCDSVVTVTLNELTLPQATVNAAICSGEAYTLPGGDVVMLAGTYTDTIAGFRCDSVVTVNLSVDNPPSTSPSLAICAGDSVTLNGVDYYHETGVYSDTLSTSGCDSVITLLLTVWPRAETTIDRGICTGDSATINGITYYSATGTYTDTLAGFRCDSIVTLNLTVSDLSVTYIDESICAGESATINGVDFYTATGIYADTLAGTRCDSVVVLDLIVWPVNETQLSQTICAGESATINGVDFYAQTGVYSDTLAGVHCDSIVTLNLEVREPVIDTIAVTPANCNGEGGRAVIGHGNLPGPVSYTVTDAVGQTQVFTDEVLNLDPGQYTIELEDGMGCTATRTFTIDEGEAHTLDVVPAVATVYAGMSVELQAEPAEGDFTWSPPFFLSCPTCPVTVATPDYSIRYIVTSNRDGCTATDTAYIEVRQPEAFIPTAFSPNGDQANDVLQVMDKNIEELLFFRVYNRWGELLFETGSLEEGWDGRYRGVEQEMDMYIYHVSVILTNGRPYEVRGEVLLMR